MNVSIRGTVSTSFAKFVVVCLLVLAVSPFTAPFSTCDLGAPGLCSDTESTVKVAADMAVAVPAPVAASPLMASVGRVYVPAVSRTTALHASLFPLRL